MTKLLMLDFDGVLHPVCGDAVPLFEFAPRLAASLHGASCSIVVSSTWRDNHDLAHLKSLLPAALAARIVGVLGPDCRARYVRYATILEWLRANASSADWRALDDSAGAFPPACRQLILCDGMEGFGPRQETELVRWLRDS